MQGVGSINMSMGGAATAQPLDISGAIHWNPAALSAFDDKIMRFDIGLFFSSPELSSSLPAEMLGPGAPAVSGTTEDDRGVSPMPALAMVWGKKDSKHTFGVSAFGISGFGVTFPEEANNPFSPSFNPTVNSNPINYPQAANGFGRIESDYMLLQVSGTYSYEINSNLSVGIQPNINYAALELAPNPLASPDFPPDLGGTGRGYPIADKATALGYGAQFGLFYDSKNGIKLGASYKTAQKFREFYFENTYLDGSDARGVRFQMDYPAIMSLGLGYSAGQFDFALDFRRVMYEDTEGFEASGWEFAPNGFPTGAVEGFGWKNMSIVSTGLQYKGLNKVPLRIGYTYSSNPIDEKLAFFSSPATAIIKHAFQFGFSYEINDSWRFDSVYHYGTSGDATEGQLLNPMQITPDNLLGEIPGTTVSYDMTTSMIMVGLNYTFNKKIDN